MNFASFPYLVFLLITIAIYFKSNQQWKPIVLLASSYFFYALFGVGFALLMLSTTIITYTSAHYSYYSKTKKLQHLFFYLGITIDLLVFILFKYIHIIDINIMNWPNWSAQQVLIPIGISFYTFKTIGYCIDVYKRKYAPEESFLYYALSVSFFPQLIAGPIEKSILICKQLKQQTPFDIQNVVDGGKLILWGLFKKIVIADSIGEVINPVFSNIDLYKGFDFWIAFIAFTYQVYTDFSGYSDIAIGSAKVFNVNLPANFNKPFFSNNLSEFWRRWHISLYKWLKEYIFDLLLKGYSTRDNKILTSIKVAILFFIVGLWHGATLNYFLYVATAYVWLLLDVLFRKNVSKLIFLTKLKAPKVLLKITNYVVIILMISCFEIFFKGNNLDYSISIFKNLFSLKLHGLKIINVISITGYIVLFELLQSFQITATGHCFEKVNKFNLRLLIILFLIFSILLSCHKSELSFQYFQF